MNTLITNVTMVLEDRIQKDSWLLLSHGKIAAAGTKALDASLQNATDDGIQNATDINLQNATDVDLQNATDDNLQNVMDDNPQNAMDGNLQNAMDNNLQNAMDGNLQNAMRLADTILDGEGQYLAPGLIDIHLHGGNGYDFMDGTEEAFQGIAQYHASHGTTSMLVTTVSAAEDEILRVLNAFLQYAPQISCCHLLGVHLEGPYFNKSQCGAQDPGFITAPDREQCRRFLDTGCIRRISLAPELPGALDLGSRLDADGILVSAGHTEADFDLMEEAFSHGFRLMTHLYSGMTGVHRKGPFRQGGAVEAGLLSDTAAVEIIADGCHLPGCLLRLIRKCKKPQDIILISDAMRGAGLAEGTVTKLGSLSQGQDVIIEDGVAKMPNRTSFAGSVASGDRLIRTMRDMGNVPLYEAVAMMTANPARLLGLERTKGRLLPGMDADVILFDENIHIKAVWTGGKRVL